MANVLLLTHRIPYPPDKGDKIHTYQLLRHLGRRHHLMLGTFVDNGKDEQHVATLRGMCAELHVARLRPPVARLRGLMGLFSRQSLSRAVYRDAGLERWVRSTAASRALDAVIVHSSSMLQYAEALTAPLIADMNDVDSAKWADYSAERRWPMSWIYRRESHHLLAEERRGARQAKLSLFATVREAALFRSLAPESADRVDVLGNGVDAELFSEQAHRPNPFGAEELPIVFVGSMDYYPNIDAVCWFAKSILPSLRQQWPQVRFTVVGRNPAAAVQALAAVDVTVTGEVPDTRPWLQHAAAVVAPLRVVRGVTNKVLEAMAMARPVVATQACAESLQAQDGVHLLVAQDEAGFVDQLSQLLCDRPQAAALGRSGRAFVTARYSWAERMACLDGYLQRVARVPA